MELENSEVKSIIDKFPTYLDNTISGINEITEQMLNCANLRDARKLFYDFIDKNIKEPGKGEVCTGYFTYRYCKLHDWIEKYFTPLFIKKNGQLRTLAEAARICAEKWYEVLFKNPVQSNGATDEHSIKLCLLGTSLKMDVLMNISDEVKEKTKELIYNFYMSFTHRYEGLSVDYGPNDYLYDILVEAGIKEDDVIRDICPWKTVIQLDRTDNSVSIRHYDEVKYI